MLTLIAQTSIPQWLVMTCHWYQTASEWCSYQGTAPPINSRLRCMTFTQSATMRGKGGATIKCHMCGENHYTNFHLSKRHGHWTRKNCQAIQTYIPLWTQYNHLNRPRHLQWPMNGKTRVLKSTPTMINKHTKPHPLEQIQRWNSIVQYRGSITPMIWRWVSWFQIVNPPVKWSTTGIFSTIFTW